MPRHLSTNTSPHRRSRPPYGRIPKVRCAECRSHLCIDWHPVRHKWPERERKNPPRSDPRGFVTPLLAAVVSDRYSDFMKRFAWLTDIHLNFLGCEEVESFMREVSEVPCDGILLSGDTGEAPNVTHHLNNLDRSEERRVGKE